MTSGHDDMGVVEGGEVGGEGGKEDGRGSAIAISVVEEIAGAAVVADALRGAGEGSPTDESRSRQGASGSDRRKEPRPCVFELDTIGGGGDCRWGEVREPVDIGGGVECRGKAEDVGTKATGEGVVATVADQGVGKGSADEGVGPVVASDGQSIGRGRCVDELVQDG